jgi:hypothetical protein
LEFCLFVGHYYPSSSDLEVYFASTGRSAFASRHHHAGIRDVPPSLHHPLLAVAGL